MTFTTATLSDVTAFDGRLFAFPDGRRLFGGLAAGLGGVAATGLIAGAATIAAVWMVGTALSGNPHLRLRAPLGPAAIALANHDPALSGGALFGSARMWNKTAYAPSAQRVEKIAATPAPQPARIAAVPPPAKQAQAALNAVTAAPLPPPRRQQQAPALSAPIHVAELAPPAAAPALTHVAKLTPPASMPAPEPAPAVEHVANIPLPRPYPGKRESDQVPPAEAPRPVVAALPPPVAEKRVPRREAHNLAPALPGPDSRTAIYDIAAHTVYLPNGKRLEAHSGLGPRLDNPRFTKVKMRGPTPPNVYELTMRRQLFHGVRAIRLNPVDEAKMYGRDGILAHTYMLGPSGQSFGCVSFKNYPAFLRAFLNGEVTRMVVVPHLKDALPRLARVHDSSGDAFAYADE